MSKGPVHSGGLGYTSPTGDIIYRQVTVWGIPKGSKRRLKKNSTSRQKIEETEE